MPPDAAVDLCAFDDLVDGEIVELRADGLPVAVARWGDRVYAFNAKCPHKGAPMRCAKLMARLEAAGPGVMEVPDDVPVVSCPWHGWEFALDSGENVADATEKSLRLQQCEIFDGRVRLSRARRGSEDV